MQQTTAPQPSHLTTDPIIQLWLLRILVPLEGHREFISNRGFASDCLAVTVGLGHWVDPSQYSEPNYLKRSGKSAKGKKSDLAYSQPLALSQLRLIHQKAEVDWSNANTSAILHQNVERLAQLVGLTATDRRILEFAVMIHTERLLDEAADFLGRLSSVQLYGSLSTILNLPVSDIQVSLSENGILARSGLVTLDRNHHNSVRDKLDLISEAFGDLMVSCEADPLSLLRGTVMTTSPAHLGLADYQHIKPTLDLLVPYLRGAAAERRKGVNIFIYGAPGTGKSQLARVLASALGTELFEVASEDADEDPIGGELRLRAFRAAQSFFAQRQALIVFDEVEDVFNDGDSLAGRKSTAQVRKRWVTRMLEENPVPTLWLSNSVRCLDRAFIRRFDMIFEVPVPPKSQRERILQATCGDLLDAGSLKRIADTENLAPALVTKTASVVRAIRDELGSARTADAFERLISNTLEAQGHTPLQRHDPSRLPEVYDPMFIHADANLQTISEGLLEARTGRLCLYGPPGTGKTAYGRWIAQRLSVPLMVKRASDLMGPYVGESEQNVARAFQEASEEGAVLLIDEVDSFLQDRRGAQRGWEVRLVNEMLTQMEAYPGVFIASTNLMDDLDPAALRRFDLKVKFDFLRAEQAWELLQRQCGALSLSQPQQGLFSSVARLDVLTPGDFATVVRQHRFRPVTSPEAFVNALENECAVKQGGKKSVGFI